MSPIQLRKAFSNFVFACVQNRVVINICFLGNNVALTCRSPVTCLVAEVWPALEVKPGEKKTTQSSGKRKKRLAHLPRVPHCAFDCLLLLTRPNNACCVGYTYWRCMHHCLMLRGRCKKAFIFGEELSSVWNKLTILPSSETQGQLVRTTECSCMVNFHHEHSIVPTNSPSPKMLFYLKPEATSTNERIIMLDLTIFSMGCFNL